MLFPPFFALFVMASVTAHAETKIGVAVSLFDDIGSRRYAMECRATLKSSEM